MEIITSISFEELESLITKAVKKAQAPSPITTPAPDRIGISEAADITGLKKATLYRKSFDGSIPCERFGKFLIFSRKALSVWMQEQTTPKVSQRDAAADHLAKEARKR